MQAVLSTVKIQNLFEESLTDFVKAIRDHKNDEHVYISSVMSTLKKDITSLDLDVKSLAIEKLIYLHMLGYDAQFASFSIVELMSSLYFSHRRIAYLAAAQIFSHETDVVLLTVHLFKKSFSSLGTISSSPEAVQYEIGSSLGCLASICTPDLSSELANDIYGLLNSSRPYIRKKAVLVLYKIFCNYPKALRLSFGRLKEKLEDNDNSVICSAVSVICELSKSNPKNYLGLAPVLFSLLSTSSHTWIVIKTVKLLGSLVPIEPRLAKKLIEPFINIINTTTARSLLYECIQTIILSKLASQSILLLCLDKLKTFVLDPDQNLKYLGLQGMYHIALSHSHLITPFESIIIECLEDEDISIRSRALAIISVTVSQSSLIDTVSKLMNLLHKADGSFRDNLINSIISMCSSDHYQKLQDFNWYLHILLDISHYSYISYHSCSLICQQVLDIHIRVSEIRPLGLEQIFNILSLSRIKNSTKPDLYHESYGLLLSAVGWLVGEYSNIFTPDHPHIITTLSTLCLDLLSLSCLPFSSSVITNFIMASFKILIHLLTLPTPPVPPNGSDSPYISIYISSLTPLSKSPTIEIQEISFFILQLCQIISNDFESSQKIPHYLHNIFEEYFKPVHPQAQYKVSSKFLDLSKPFIIESDDEEEDIYMMSQEPYSSSSFEISSPLHTPNKETSEKQKAKALKQLAAHKSRLQNDPHYIMDKKTNSTSISPLNLKDDDIYKIPTQSLELDTEDLKNLSISPSNDKIKITSHSLLSSQKIPQLYNVDTSEMIPDNVDPISLSSPQNPSSLPKDSLASIDLTEPSSPILNSQPETNIVSDTKHKHHHHKKKKRKDKEKEKDIIMEKEKIKKESELEIFSTPPSSQVNSSQVNSSQVTTTTEIDILSTFDPLAPATKPISNPISHSIASSPSSTIIPSSTPAFSSSSPLSPSIESNPSIPTSNHHHHKHKHHKSSHQPPRHYKLFSNLHLSLFFSFEPDPRPSNISIILDILSFTSITSISILFNSSPNQVKYLKNHQEIVSSLSNGEKKQLTLQFEVPSFNGSQKIEGYLTYHLSNGEQTHPISLHLPASAFIYPKPMNLDDFHLCISSSTFNYYSNFTLSISSGNLKKFLHSLCNHFHTHLINFAPNQHTATLCGFIIPQHQGIIAFLVKAVQPFSSDDIPSVMIKIKSNYDIVNQLTKEIQDFYSQ